MRRGRKSAAQTTAPKSDRIYGSSKNKPKSASSEKSASSIKLSEKITNSLKNKLSEFKETHKTEKVSLNDLKAVYRRGLGAYSSSHRPTITGGVPNTRNAWAMARVNKFLKKAAGQKVKAAYVQDDDLLKYEQGGKTKKSRQINEGDCYKISGEYILENSVSPIGKKIYLVHAEVQGQGKLSKIRYGHAWIEDDTLVYDFSNGRQIILPKYIYYNLGDVNTKDPKKYRRYTAKEARKKMLETKHYGAWDIETKYENGGELEENQKNLFKMLSYQNKLMENGGQTDKITCVNCMWEWQDESDDKYICHKCGLDNNLFYNVLKETKSLEEIAENQGVEIEYLKKQLEIGKESEKSEHIKSGSGILGDEIAETIALHHLDEAANYYEEYDDEVLNIQKENREKNAEFSVWYEDEAYDFADLYEAREHLKNSQKKGFIRDFYGYKITDTYKDGGKTPKEIYQSPKEFIELQKEEADAVIFSRRTLLGKTMIINAYIEMAEKRLEEAEGAIEKNIWQETINIWKQTKKDINEYVFNYEEGGMTEDGKNSGCGCTKYAKGGLAYGNSHAKGGIPMKVKSTGQNIEIEGGEGVINKRSMQMTKKVEFQGRKMTPCEVISKINQMGGGVKFDCGDVKEIVDKDGEYE